MMKMQGKICLITGGTNGIGKSTTIALSRMVEPHRYVDTGRKKGNVVIQVAQDQQQPLHKTVAQHGSQGG